MSTELPGRCEVCGKPIPLSPFPSCSRDCSQVLRLRRASERSVNLDYDQLLHLTHHHRAYGLTCEEFEALLDRADRKCERCGVQPEPIGRIVRIAGLFVDHNHTTGAIRGMLCTRCNAHMRRVDSGERPVDEATARYLSLATAQGVNT